jgi:amino acid permease
MSMGEPIAGIFPFFFLCFSFSYNQLPLVYIQRKRSPVPKLLLSPSGRSSEKSSEPLSLVLRW